MKHKRLICTKLFTLHWYPYLIFEYHNLVRMLIISIGFLTMTWQGLDDD